MVLSEQERAGCESYLAAYDVLMPPLHSSLGHQGSEDEHQQGNDDDQRTESIHHRRDTQADHRVDA